MYSRDKIEEIFPGATETQMDSMVRFIDQLIDNKINSVSLESDRVNIVTVDTGMLPYTKATSYLEMIASRMNAVRSDIECIFVGASANTKHPTSVITLPKEPCIVKIPVGYMGQELVDRYMDKFSVFEQNLHDAGYNTKFVADRGSGSIDVE